jgi:hypothetical protein
MRRDLLIPRTKTATTASVREYDKSVRAGRNRQIARQHDARGNDDRPGLGPAVNCAAHLFSRV